MSDVTIKLTERRNFLSSFLITLLIGMAFQEMMSVVKESVQQGGINPQTLLLPLTFFCVSMRFFIGNQLHLLSDSFARVVGSVWVYDLMVIIVQSMVLILAGAFSSVEANRNVEFGFVECILFLLILDVAWIVSQGILGRAFRSWKRESVPWGWAILNSVLVVLIYLVSVCVDDLYSTSGLISILILNLLAFVVDVFWLDYGAIEAS